MSGIGPGAGSLLALTIALSVVGLFGSQAFVERCLFRPYWYLRNREYSTALLAGFVHAEDNGLDRARAAEQIRQ